jgi:hypothetical protein
MEVVADRHPFEGVSKVAGQACKASSSACTWLQQFQSTRQGYNMIQLHNIPQL